MFSGSPGNKPPLLPIGAERAIRLRTAKTLNPNLCSDADDGIPNSFAPEWGNPYQTYFKASKITFVPPVADPSRPNLGDENQKQRSSSSSEQAGPIYQAPHNATAEAAWNQDAKQTPLLVRPMQTIYEGKAAQPNWQQPRASDVFGMPPVPEEEEEEEVPFNFASPDPQSAEAPLEYTNEILYNDLVTIQQRSCKIAQYIRDALPTHMQRQLFQQEIIGQHLVAERKFCELLEVRYKAIYEWMAQNSNQAQAQAEAEAKAQNQDQKQDQKDHPKQNKHQDQNQDIGQNPYRPTAPNNVQYRAMSPGPAYDPFDGFKKGSLLSGSVPDSSSGGLPASSSVTVDGSSLWSISGSSTASGRRTWGLPPALHGSLFSSPPLGPQGSPFEFSQGDVQGSPEGLMQGSPEGLMQGSPEGLMQGSLNTARLATIPESPGSQGSSQATLQGPSSAATTPVPTPNGSPEEAEEQSPPQSTAVDGKASAPWCQNVTEGAAAPFKAPFGTVAQPLMYQEPSQWPPIGASARNTSGGSSASAQPTGAHQASSSTSVGPQTWPPVGSLPRSQSRAQTRAPPRNTSRGPQRKSQRSTSRAHRQLHPSVVLGCTPWAHVKAASASSGPAKFHAIGEHSRFHDATRITTITRSQTQRGSTEAFPSPNPQAAYSRPYNLRRPESRCHN
ncbi:uncharacterized protein LOC108164854 isoform X2 [Drosophila miranda]|uniref:uncharacterized protein LOC108164854 isoform X2 n=1 Tax=Drosophila miranda TaxID=7229 RepID=UPI0007E6B83C|nr:uncharacterized protein LOC108164854 isoform X2 [Drosophila miranda]